MVNENNIFTDLIPQQDEEVNIFEDIIPQDEIKTQTPIPGVFSKERYTDKKAYIGASKFAEDYEELPIEDLDFLDKFVLHTLGGNEQVFRQKKTQFGENFIEALNNRDTAGIVGMMGGAEGVRILANNALKGIFKKNPIGVVMFAIGGGTLGGTAMMQMYDRLKGVITGDEESLDEIWKKIPQDLKTNLTYEALGVFIAAVPLGIKWGLMKGKKGSEALYKLSKKLNIDFMPIDVASNFSKSFLRVGGIFPGVTGPFGLKSTVKKRGTTLSDRLDDIFYSLSPLQNLKQSKIGERLLELSTNTYKHFRKTVGKQYDRFLNLASGIKNGKKIADFDVNIVPLINRNANALDKPYLLDVARKIIRDAQAGGKGQLQPGHPNYDQAYTVALDIINRFGGKKFMDVKTLHNYVKLIGKKYIKQSYAKDGGASVKQLLELKNSIKQSFGDLDLSKIDADLADEILAQFKLADSMYNKGWKEGGKFFEGKPLFERAFAGKFEQAKHHLFDTKLTTEGTKYYDEIVKPMLQFSSKEGIDDLYKLMGKNDEAFATFVRTYLDDVFNKVGTQGKGAGEAGQTFNFLKFNADELISKLGFRNAESMSRNLTMPIKEEALTHALNILNKNNKNIVSGKDFRNFLSVLSNQQSIVIPDVAEFIRRAAVFGGIGAIVGNYLGWLNIGHVGIAGGLGLLPTLTARGIANALGNPKNMGILFDTMNTSLSYFKRYSAGIRLLDIGRDHLVEQSNLAKGEAKEEIDKILEGFEIFYNQAIENAPQSEGDEEPIEFQDIIDEETTDEEIITDDEEIVDTPVDLTVPVPNQQFDMENVVPPMVDPAQTTRSGDINPEIIEQMASLGMPLFGNEGGIASLMKHKKPQQMVA
tara:strand:- start:167 stop:2782 length:2616 start_codon:yes stop_codon:yes gene_type:complete